MESKEIKKARIDLEKYKSEVNEIEVTPDNIAKAKRLKSSLSALRTLTKNEMEDDVREKKTAYDDSKKKTAEFKEAYQAVTGKRKTLLDAIGTAFDTIRDKITGCEAKEERKALEAKKAEEERLAKERKEEEAARIAKEEEEKKVVDGECKKCDVHGIIQGDGEKSINGIEPCPACNALSMPPQEEGQKDKVNTANTQPPEDDRNVVHPRCPHEKYPDEACEECGADHQNVIDVQPETKEEQPGQGKIATCRVVDINALAGGVASGVIPENCIVPNLGVLNQFAQKYIDHAGPNDEFFPGCEIVFDDE